MRRLRALTRGSAIMREAVATARSQPVASLVSIVMVAGMCAAILLTTGRTVGAEQAVLGSIDSAGTRSIVVRAEGDAGLDTSVLDRLEGIEGIEWAGAFGAASDVTNSLIPDGIRVPARLAWGESFDALGIPSTQALQDKTAWASPQALEQLGMAEGVGGVSSPLGADYAIGGEVQVPDYLEFLEPLVIVPQSAESADFSTVSVLVVIAERPDLVAPVSKTVQSLLGLEDVTKVTMATSQSLATLRALIEGQLGTFGRSLILVIFTLTAVLVATILYGLVMLRRKDFGRRRALGASRSLIVSLLLTQMAILSAIGATLGSAAAAGALVATGDPLPDSTFFLAVGVLAVAVGVIAAVLPAMSASRRDPLRELRVP